MISLNIEKTLGFISKENVFAYETQVKAAQEALENGTGKGNDFLGWLHLPSSITAEHLADLKATAQVLRDNCEVVVVAGIGGSYLGARAVIEALSNSFQWLKAKQDGPVIVFAGHNISEDYLFELTAYLKDKKFGVINISKSGTTTETALAFRLLKKQLTQNIAHELKTPVSSIQGYLETIVNNPTLPREKINAFLERSYAQSNRLAHLLRDISVLTRMEEAPNMIETEPVNLTTMMRNILNEVTLELEEKQITAHNMLPEGLTIQGNSSLLYSIFRNLTDNAIAYAGTHISITIRCFREDERFYYFSFSDTGVGVGPEHLSRLFERFYRVDKGRSRKLGGTGLGLAIVKNAVILHGGTIFAKNTPGGGLEFIFTLSKE